MSVLSWAEGLSPAVPAHRESEIRGSQIPGQLEQYSKVPSQNTVFEYPRMYLCWFSTCLECMRPQDESPVRDTGVSGGNHIILVLFLIYKYFMNLNITMQIFLYMVKYLANTSLVFDIRHKKHVFFICVYICLYCIPQPSAGSPLKTAVVPCKSISAGAAVVSLRQ